MAGSRKRLLVGIFFAIVRREAVPPLLAGHECRRKGHDAPGYGLHGLLTIGCGAAPRARLGPRTLLLFGHASPSQSQRAVEGSDDAESGDNVLVHAAGRAAEPSAARFRYKLRQIVMQLTRYAPSPAAALARRAGAGDHASRSPDRSACRRFCP